MDADERLADHRAGAFATASTQGFAWSPGLEATIRAKRPHPLAAVKELMGPGVFPSEAEVDEFVRAYRADRQLVDGFGL